MTKTQNILTFSAAVLFAGFLALPILTSGAEASTTSRLMNCASNNKAKTIDCCKTVVREDMPHWMSNTGRNCNSAVACLGKYAYGTNYRRCRVVVWQEEDGNGREVKTPQRSRRSFN